MSCIDRGVSAGRLGWTSRCPNYRAWGVSDRLSDPRTLGATAGVVKPFPQDVVVRTYTGPLHVAIVELAVERRQAIVDGYRREVDERWQEVCLGRSGGRAWRDL